VPVALAEDTGVLEAGEHTVFRATVSNLLTPGRYMVNYGLSQSGIDDLDLRRPASEFLVTGKHQFGYVDLGWEFEIERTPRAETLEAVDR
jgi:hypothetical protein